MKNQFAGDAKENIIARWTKLKPFVEREYERIQVKKPAKVSENCPEDLKELAQIMVDMQNSKGEIKREYLKLKEAKK